MLFWHPEFVNFLGGQDGEKRKGHDGKAMPIPLYEKAIETLLAFPGSDAKWQI